MLVQMDINCPEISLTNQTSIEQKLKSKKSAYEFKYGSPKLRDELRKNCRNRIKDARKNSFLQGRPLDSDAEKGLITKILREELANLEDDIKLQELIFKELIAQADESIIEELEKEDNYFYEMSDLKVVFCPICQISGLKECSDGFKCECGICFSFEGSINSFNEKLQTIIDKHESHCNEVLNFFIEPNEIKCKFNLSVLCDKCDTITTFSN